MVSITCELSAAAELDGVHPSELLVARVLLLAQAIKLSGTIARAVD